MAAKGNGVVDGLRHATTLWNLTLARAALTPDALMLTDERDRRITFGGFAAWCERVAAGLLELGIGPDTRVTWQLPTRIETVVLSMALSRLGAVQNPIIAIYREREVRACLRQTAAEWFVILDRWSGFDYRSMAQALTTDVWGPLRLLSIDEGLPEGDPSRLPPPPTDGDAVRWIYSTSGTTSEPKGVRHTDETLLAGGRGISDMIQADSSHVYSIPFPYAHIGGPDSLVHLLDRGLATTLLETFVPHEAVAVLRRHGVTITGGSTAFYQALLAEQAKQPDEPILPALRLLVGGGAPKPPELFWRAKHELNAIIVHGYGMTECPMIANGAPTDSDDALAHADGRPVTGCEIEIRDNIGGVLGPDEIGDIWVRGPMLCKGYTDPVLTAESFDAAGWFHTGDLGCLTHDGRIALSGRTKDLIIRKGENISPREIEDILANHPSVGAVAVIGLPDPQTGERVCAVVETRHGAPPLTFAEMMRQCREAGLMTQKFPERLEVVDALPRNPTLKILKHELRARFAS